MRVSACAKDPRTGDVDRRPADDKYCLLLSPSKKVLRYVTWSNKTPLTPILWSDQLVLAVMSCHTHTQKL